MGSLVTEEAQIQAEELGEGDVGSETQKWWCEMGRRPSAQVEDDREAAQTTHSSSSSSSEGLRSAEENAEAVALTRCQRRVPSEQALSLSLHES